MTFERIQELAQYLPDTSIYFNEILGYTDQITSVNKFVKAYKDLQFGYKFIKSLVDADLTLPATVDEEELIDTFQFLKYNAYKPDVVFAISLTHPSNKNIEDAIKAFLITDESYDTLQSLTGISKEVLKIYEKLFFNIRDRKSEALFIANTVYPDSRMVEIMDNYAKNEDPGKILLRSAYNNGIEDVAYFSGLKVDCIANNTNISSPEIAQKLETALMANALYLCRNGFISQKNSGIGHAKSLLIAAKQGGQADNTQDTEGAGILGAAMMETFLSIKQPEMDNKLEIYKDSEMKKIK